MQSEIIALSSLEKFIWLNSETCFFYWCFSHLFWFDNLVHSLAEFHSQPYIELKTMDGIGGLQFITCTEYPEKLTFLTPWYTSIHISGLGNVCFFGRFCLRTKYWYLAKYKRTVFFHAPFWCFKFFRKLCPKLHLLIQIQ